MNTCNRISYSSMKHALVEFWQVQIKYSLELMNMETKGKIEHMPHNNQIHLSSLDSRKLVYERYKKDVELLMLNLQHVTS